MMRTKPHHENKLKQVSNRNNTLVGVIVPKSSLRASCLRTEVKEVLRMGARRGKSEKKPSFPSPSSVSTVSTTYRAWNAIYSSLELGANTLRLHSCQAKVHREKRPRIWTPWPKIPLSSFSVKREGRRVCGQRWRRCRGWAPAGGSQRRSPASPAPPPSPQSPPRTGPGMQSTVVLSLVRTH